MFTGIISAIRNRLPDERGQVLWLTAGLIAVLGGMTATAVDLGSYMADRRDHQNRADAIALAAALELPDEDAALAAANDWAVKNGVDPSNMTVTITPQDIPAVPNPKVSVQVESEHEFFFARLVGITSAEVSADATAIKTSPAGGSGVIPFSVTQPALNGIGLGDEVVLKYDANNIQTGNTGPIRIDGPGGGSCNNDTNKYCYGLKYGSESVVCAEGADPTYCDGPTQVDTEPGNKVGDTRTAIQWRLNETHVQCDEFTEVFEDDPTTSEDGVYRITQDCNPFLPGGYESHRVLIVPVIEQLCNGSCEVTIVDFALFFLEGFANGGCTGNDCEVIGRFVRVHQNVGMLAGTFDEEAANQFVRLVE
jgi:Flp pilus assembly protein TadG